MNSGHLLFLISPLGDRANLCSVISFGEMEEFGKLIEREDLVSTTNGKRDHGEVDEGERNFVTSMIKKVAYYRCDNSVN